MSTTSDSGMLARISELERRYVEEVLATDFRTSRGSVMTNRLERAWAQAHAVDFAIAFVNGTATMHAGLLAKAIGPGDEVIVPPLTMASTTFVVLQAGATPVFADVDAETFQISPRSIRERVSEHTKAIIPVDLYGLSPEMDEIMAIAVECDLFVVEDAAQTMGSTYKGRNVGSIGHMGSFSLQSSKHLTSGEGGIVTTNDEELANAVRRVNSLGYAGVGAMKGKITKDDIQDPSYSRHVSFGFNYRMPELCAAVALAQFERREELVRRRVDVARLFGDAAGGCDWLLPQRTPAHCTNSYWTWAVRIEHPDHSWRHFRDHFRRLGGDGIYGAWKLTYLEPVFAREERYPPGLCPVAERLQPRLLQFKTSYWDWAKAQEQASILRRTIEDLS
ncbi:MAG: DegT/DnrJ/EryC1/StrS family aminotransferase [Solirubrobacteraceae bacterium]